MERLVVFKFNDSILGIDIEEVEKFEREISGEKININLKNGEKILVEEIIDVNFSPSWELKPMKNFYKISKADFINKFFKFERKISYLINSRKFIERLKKNEKG